MRLPANEVNVLKPAPGFVANANGECWKIAASATSGSPFRRAKSAAVVPMPYCARPASTSGTDRMPPPPCRNSTVKPSR